MPSKLSDSSGLLARFGNLAFAVLVVCIGLLIIPLQPPVVDALIMVNAVISAVLLFCSFILLLLSPFLFLLSQGFLQRFLSTFAASLLFVTLFRFALNIAVSCRILLAGAFFLYPAGAIINTFGNFVVGGNFIVGAVLFLLFFSVLIAGIFCLLFVGAQMVSAISPESARSGSSSACESRQCQTGLDSTHGTSQGRLQKSQFDWAIGIATRFMKCDAIAGVVILLINMIGGINVGIFAFGRDAGWCVKRFGILAIGSGLVWLIPAFLTSLALFGLARIHRARLLLAELSRLPSAGATPAQSVVTKTGKVGGEAEDAGKIVLDFTTQINDNELVAAGVSATIVRLVSDGGSAPAFNLYVLNERPVSGSLRLRLLADDGREIGRSQVPFVRGADDAGYIRFPLDGNVPTGLVRAISLSFGSTH